MMRPASCVAGLCLCMFVACTCREPSPAPAAAPPPVLTEADAAPHDGGLVGVGWVLPLDEAWLEVRPTARTRLQPRAAAWAVDPAVPAHVTVECGVASADAPEAALRVLLAASKNVETLGVRRVPPRGQWLDGAVARWVSPDELHVTARVWLLSSRCDVHAWGPASKGTALADRLEAVVLRFSSTRPALTEALNDLSRFIANDGAAASKSGALRDAGLEDMVGPVLMTNALARLDGERLAERFRLRLEMLNALSPVACGGLVQHRLEPSSELLEAIPERSAVRWVQLTREALGLAMAADGPVVLPSTLEIQQAVRALATKDESFAQALAVLQQGALVAPELVCEAERLRLERLLALPAPTRTLLLRSLVATK